jgi:hypothetical protein
MDTNAEAELGLHAEAACGYSIGCGNFHFTAAERAIERAIEIGKTLNPHDEVDYIAFCCSAIIMSYCGFEAKIEEEIGFIETECYFFGNTNNELISFLNEIDSRDETTGKRLTTIEKYKKISKLFNITISCKEYNDISFIKETRDRLVHSKIYSKIYRNGDESTYGIGRDAIFKVIDKYQHYPEVKKFRSPFYRKDVVHFPHLIANALFAQWCLDTIKKFIKSSTVHANSIRDYFPHPSRT